ncbi:hypothetical protein F4809DRAFT_604886 [Biscogniauxia mediterranea]|nr:hypothetical protein F4809DRAFT_604886 [Biscogniauxia mediterranea]
MQRVTSLLPNWDRNRSSTGSNASHTRKNSVEKVRGWADKLPSSVNRLSASSKIDREAFWPTTLDKECERAARILKSFCNDGFSTPDDRPGTPSTLSSGQSSNKILKKIPPRIIQNAVGLAVFTSMRSGLWTSGSGGSGILIARKTDGTWSPPSGLLLQTPSLGFVIGVDIYDCVLVINNFTVLEAFARPKLTLGTDVSLTNGPLVRLGLLENDMAWIDLSDTAITYVKAKGQCSEVKLDGTILHERVDENERFYGMKLGVAKILAGDINQSLPQTRPLTEMLKAAEGRTDYDMTLVEHLSSYPVPGDASIETPGAGASTPLFGIPTLDDPDPFGVLALEMAGIGIREAGTKLRPESSQFEFHPSPSSPIFPRASRQSVDTFLSRSNRGSYMSNRTIATERSHMTDAGTQTFSIMTPETTPTHSQSQSEDGNQQTSADENTEVRSILSADFTKIDIGALRSLSNFPDLEEEPETPSSTKIPDSQFNVEAKEMKDECTSTSASDLSEGADKPLDEKSGSVDGSDDEDGEDDDFDDDDDDDDDEEPVVVEVATAQSPARMTMVVSQIMHAKGAVVTIPRRVPPPLPVRSPARTSRRRSQMPDVSSLIGSPLKQQFDADAEFQEALTPKAESIVSKHTETTDDNAEDKNEILNKEGSMSALSESPASPRRESKDVSNYSPKAEEQTPLPNDAITQESQSTEDSSDLQTGHGVPVTVA